MRPGTILATLVRMRIDGSSIARDIRNRVRAQLAARGRQPTLGVIVVKDTPEIRTFVNIKQCIGREIGVVVDVVQMDANGQDTASVLEMVSRTAETHDGVVLQLPLPATVDTEVVLAAFPLSCDVDVLGSAAWQSFERGSLPYLPPVVGAMDEILRREHVDVAGQEVLIVGEGRLVGAPASVWAAERGAQVTVVNKQTTDIESLARCADVIILGAGSPGVLKSHMVKPGVIILDAGTSESEGVLKGDADPACEAVASIFTPTPGGIGPITVAKLFENLVKLTEAVGHSS